MLYTYSNGETVRYAVVSDDRYSGQCTYAGDSGGSVFTVRDDGYILAKGILSGGKDDAGDDHHGTATHWCQLVFTNVADAIQAFPGSGKLG